MGAVPNTHMYWWLFGNHWCICNHLVTVCWWLFGSHWCVGNHLAIVNLLATINSTHQWPCTNSFNYTLFHQNSGFLISPKKITLNYGPVLFRLSSGWMLLMLSVVQEGIDTCSPFPYMVALDTPTPASVHSFGIGFT